MDWQFVHTSCPILILKTKSYRNLSQYCNYMCRVDKSIFVCSVFPLILYFIVLGYEIKFSMTEPITHFNPLVDILVTESSTLFRRFGIR